MEDTVDVRDAIRGLRSVRQFADRPLDEATLRAILDAGRRAQSSKNTQPWQFVVVRERETLVALSKCGDYAGHLAGAAAGVALISTVKDGYDLGQATACLMLAAWELGVGSCIASIYDADKARGLLGVPADRHFDVALSFGYPAADWQPTKMGGRRPLEDVVRWERW
jgi:nitroreductase